MSLHKADQIIMSLVVLCLVLLLNFVCVICHLLSNFDQDEELQELAKSNREKNKQIDKLREHIEKRDIILNKSINQTKELLINKVSQKHFPIQ